MKRIFLANDISTTIQMQILKKSRQNNKNKLGTFQNSELTTFLFNIVFGVSSALTASKVKHVKFLCSLAGSICTQLSFD